MHAFPLMYDDHLLYRYSARGTRSHRPLRFKSMVFVNIHDIMIMMNINYTYRYIYIYICEDEYTYEC